jgi:peptide/nickel transport system permease protein
MNDAVPTAAEEPSRWRRLRDSDAAYSFLRTPAAILAAMLSGGFVMVALLAPWIAPHQPYDPSRLVLLDAFLPPAWVEGGSWAYPLGTDQQARDLLSAMMYGLRTSLMVGLAAVGVAMVLGVGLGLISGYVGGAVDAVIMRIADIQLSFPAILVALIIDGVLRGLLPRALHEELAIYVVIASIAVSNWVRFARTVRGSTLVERDKEYVQAARLVGRSRLAIMVRHILPNISGPILVIATIDLAVAILQEATLSFLGVGLPPTQPSLGTLVENGRNFLFSGEWWIVLFPGLVLAVIVLAVNLLGDWLRDLFNPKLR